MVLLQFNKNSAITKADVNWNKFHCIKKCFKWHFSIVQSMKTATVWIKDSAVAL